MLAGSFVLLCFFSQNVLICHIKNVIYFSFLLTCQSWCQSFIKAILEGSTLTYVFAGKQTDTIPWNSRACCEDLLTFCRFSLVETHICLFQIFMYLHTTRASGICLHNFHTMPSSWQHYEFSLWMNVSGGLPEAMQA